MKRGFYSCGFCSNEADSQVGFFLFFDIWQRIVGICAFCSNDAGLQVGFVFFFDIWQRIVGIDFKATY